MNNLERRDAGMLYIADEAVFEEMKRARRLTQQLNTIDRSDFEGISAIVKQLFSKSDNALVNPPFYCDYGSHIEVGKNFFANYNCTILDVGRVIIGDNCQVGPNVAIYTAGHPIHPAARNTGYEYGIDVRIGDNVWLGGNCVICPGVTIGDNAVIGAGSVVTRDIPAWSFAAGNPCRVIRAITEDDRERFFRNQSADVEALDAMRRMWQDNADAVKYPVKKNIIFDMGRVLIRFDAEYFVDRLGVEDEEDRCLLVNEIFLSPDWPLIDSGELTEEELEARVRKRLPERLHTLAHRLIFEWDQPIEPIPEMADYIAKCKKRGMGIYLLSNASLRQRDYWPRIPGHEFFDGRIVSAEYRCSKPDLKIYRVLLNAFHLKAEDCFFVDDTQENVDAAVRLGMMGHLFTGDTQALRVAVEHWLPSLQ